jgi:hypothetical protein
MALAKCCIKQDSELLNLKLVKSDRRDIKCNIKIQKKNFNILMLIIIEKYKNKI